MKALVAGGGSIGKRHIRNLLQRDDIEGVLVYTHVADCAAAFNGDARIKMVTSLSDCKADFAVIANDTSRHIATAVDLAQQGIHLFVEKPLSHNLENIDALSNLVEKRGVKVFVAYNLRFLGILRDIKKRLAEDILGDLYFAKIEVGQYLPAWRADADYRTSYSACAERGGGVALDLSHEIDYMRYLFGDPYTWKTIRAKVSDLEINAEDIFEGIYVYPDNFICNVHLDYLQKIKKREIRIEGSRGSLLCDFVKQYLKVIENGKELVVSDTSLFDVEKTYRDELHEFIDAVNEGREPCITLSDGIKALALLEDGHVQR